MRATNKQTNKNNDKTIGERVRDSRWEIEVKIKVKAKNQSTPKYKLLTLNYLPGREKRSLPKKEKKDEQDQKKPMGKGAVTVLDALFIQYHNTLKCVLSLQSVKHLPEVVWKSRIQTQVASLQKLHSEPLNYYSYYYIGLPTTRQQNVWFKCCTFKFAFLIRLLTIPALVSSHYRAFHSI